MGVGGGAGVPGDKKEREKNNASEERSGQEVCFQELRVFPCHLLLLRSCSCVYSTAPWLMFMQRRQTGCLWEDE